MPNTRYLTDSVAAACQRETERRARPSARASKMEIPASALEAWAQALDDSQLRYAVETLLAEGNHRVRSGTGG